MYVNKFTSLCQVFKTDAHKTGSFFCLIVCTRSSRPIKVTNCGRYGDIHLHVRRYMDVERTNCVVVYVTAGNWHTALSLPFLYKTCPPIEGKCGLGCWTCSCIGGSRPSCWERPSLKFRVRGEARKAEARGSKGRQRGLDFWRWGR